MLGLLWHALKVIYQSVISNSHRDAVCSGQVFPGGVQPFNQLE